ncbi:DNA ligase [uncultured Desulfobacter sp.]|uniref:DNA ligase n=1 Tax=uncultured Desulfobacter sp. TaxID=240139 RepID=UPI0029F574AB|nr:DNA ligase [uncultured Desulfobacter sp.]
MPDFVKNIYCKINKMCLIGTMLSVFLCTVCTAETPHLQKARSYTGNEDITGWVMSEKLDGIRGYWDGSRLLTRKGLPLHPPPWFIENFPTFELDGELWSKQGEFEFIQSVVLDANPGPGWEKINYHIFEAPNQKGTFLQRLDRTKQWFALHPNAHVRVIPQTLVQDRFYLNRFVIDVESRGGEGVILKNPNMPYHTGRSEHVLKVKKARDMEGLVIGINKGKGKYEKAMGSLTLKLENGVIFKLGTGFSDMVRNNPPAVGTTVTFKYHGFSINGVPKFASFLRVRAD